MNTVVPQLSTGACHRSSTFCLVIRENIMKNGSKRCDELMTYLTVRLEAGGLEYREAVMVEDLRTVMARVRSRIKDLETDRTETRAVTAN